MDFSKLLSTARGKLITALTGITALAIGIPITVVATSGSGRSVPAFCQTYYSQLDRIMKMAQQPAGSQLGDAFQSMAAISEMRVMFDALDKVAPETIEPDVANIRDSMKSAEQGAG